MEAVLKNSDDELTDKQKFERISCLIEQEKYYSVCIVSLFLIL